MKHKVWIKYKRTLLPSDVLTYAQCRNDCIAEVWKAKYDLKATLLTASRLILKDSGGM